MRQMPRDGGAADDKPRHRNRCRTGRSDDAVCDAVPAELARRLLLLPVEDEQQKCRNGIRGRARLHGGRLRRLLVDALDLPVDEGEEVVQLLARLVEVRAGLPQFPRQALRVPWGAYDTLRTKAELCSDTSASCMQ